MIINIIKKRHLPLFLIFFNVLFLAISNANEIQTIKSKDLFFNLKNKTFKDIIIDVRTPYEVKTTGTIKGAIVKNAYDKNFSQYISKLDKTKTYIVYCYSGSRSSAVVSLMNKFKIKGISLFGGIVDWQKNKYPTYPFIKNIVIINK